MLEADQHYQNAASLKWVEIKVRGQDFIPRYWCYCPCGRAVLGTQLDPAHMEDLYQENELVLHIPLQYFPDETRDTISLILSTLGQSQDEGEL